MAFLAGAATDPGRRRKANEDSILEPLSIPWPGGGGGVVLAVADGVGGAVGGAVASSVAIGALRTAFTDSTLADPVERLRDAVAAANHAVRLRAGGDSSLRGMATTMVAAAAIEKQVWFASVGDSRGYLIQNGDLCQVTIDHSLVGEAIRAGLLTPEEAAVRPERHVITRSLGQDAAVSIDCFGPLRLAVGDTILLCSDGLHDVVDEAGILDACARLVPDQAARELVRLANEAGGPDNISAVILTNS